MLTESFALALAQLGPFDAAPRLAVAVSGGADSMALALLTDHWVRRHGGSMVALIVDHGLREGSAVEAAVTRDRLLARGIEARVDALSGLRPGPKMQELARIARYAVLTEAAQRAGALFLLLGHHAADQAETVAMRAARGDGGLEGMARWAARNQVVLLRPLLELQPAALRAYLRETGVAWVEDPSNQDTRFERVRVRQAGTGRAPPEGGHRRQAERAAAAFLTQHAELRPEGFALVRVPALPAAALAALLRVIGGGDHPPARATVAALAAALRPATLGGVRVVAAGRLGPGWLLAREPAACAPARAATPNILWDRRFRLLAPVPGSMLGALGDEAARYRKAVPLPALVLRGMPCLRNGAGATTFPLPPSLALFCPPAPAASHPFST